VPARVLRWHNLIVRGVAANHRRSRTHRLHSAINATHTTRQQQRGGCLSTAQNKAAHMAMGVKWAAFGA
jgi:hypothetical protein